MIAPKGKWGFIPITASLGSSTWETSLLPTGDKSYFIALKANVRKKEKVSLGNTVTLEYELR